MLSIVQILEFELGTGCNLGRVHDACPNMHPERYASLDTSRELTDDMIVDTAVKAYNELGFTGLIGFIYYNEPLMQADRLFGIVFRIKHRVPSSRFILWTNGMLIPEKCDDYCIFEQIVISGYNEKSMRGARRLNNRQIKCKLVPLPLLDSRLVQIEPQYPAASCLRPFVEFIIDNYGNTHLCCYDWRGKATFGNLHDTPMFELVARWRQMLPAIVGQSMTVGAPEACRQCGYRWDRIQLHDLEIARRADAYRQGLKRKTR